MIDITPIIQAVITLIGVVLTSLVVPLIRSKTTAAQQEEINGWVRVAVAAAEQLYKGQGRGPEKLAYVRDWLAKQGITMDTDKLESMIEAAVYELTNSGLLISAAPEVSE